MTTQAERENGNGRTLKFVIDLVKLFLVIVPLAVMVGSMRSDLIHAQREIENLKLDREKDQTRYVSVDHMATVNVKLDEIYRRLGQIEAKLDKR
jgi:hypothetical protein